MAAGKAIVTALAERHQKSSRELASLHTIAFPCRPGIVSVGVLSICSFPFRAYFGVKWRAASFVARRRLGLKRARVSAPMRNGNSSSKAVTFWYPLNLPISYEAAKGSSLQGDGRTLAISSGAVRFVCDRNLLVGQLFRLSIQWPARLSDGTSLSLWATGKVQRCVRSEVEVDIVRHGFRTRGRDGSTVSTLLDAMAGKAS